MAERAVPSEKNWNFRPHPPAFPSHLTLAETEATINSVGKGDCGPYGMGMKTKLALTAAAVVASMVTAAVADVPSYSITQLGLTDAAHISSNGYPNNRAAAINDSGQVVGIADEPGFYSDVWIYSPSTHSTQLVVPGGSAGPGNIQAVYLNDAGTILADVSTFTSELGWLYSTSTGITEMVGLTDGAHTTNNGHQVNRPESLNAAGDVYGFAKRFSGTSQEGYDAWFYSPTTGVSQRIGLTDSAHVSATGYANNVAADMNEVGQVVGNSDRYSGTTQVGTDAWIFSPSNGTTQLPGLTDSAHIDNYAQHINAVGQVAGYADRADGGRDTWLFSPSSGTTSVISPVIAGVQYSISSPIAMNDAGQVAGESAQYVANTLVGRVAWLYSPSTNTTEPMGLTDSAHTSSAGYSFSDIAALNSEGFVAGYSDAFSGNTKLRPDLWLFDPHSQQTFGLPVLGQDGYANVISIQDNGTVLYSYQYSSGSLYVIDVFRWSETGGLIELGALVDGGIAAAGLANLVSFEGPNAQGQIAGYGGSLGGSGQTAFLLTPVSIPEPGTVSLVALGALGLLGRRGSRQV
jgi:hypothetical protein